MTNYLKYIDKFEMEEFAETFNFRIYSYTNNYSNICVEFITNSSSNPVAFHFTNFEVEIADLKNNANNIKDEVQNEWRNFLKGQFGKYYVDDYNAWLDEQKLSY